MNTEPLSLSLPFPVRPSAPDETLLYYNGPLLFWLPHEQRRLLAVAVPDGPHGAWPFLVVELKPTAASDLLAGKVTLRRTVLDGSGWWLLPDYGADELALQPLISVPAEWLPGEVVLPES